MPIKGEITKVCFGTPDGQILGELDSISTTELSAEAEQYVTDVPAFSQMEFHGSFKIESNNERKMHGMPLRRGKINWRAFDKAVFKRVKKRNRKGWIYIDSELVLAYPYSLAECPYCGYIVDWMDRERHCPRCEKRLRVN